MSTATEAERECKPKVQRSSTTLDEAIVGLIRTSLDALQVFPLQVLN